MMRFELFITPHGRIMIEEASSNIVTLLSPAESEKFVHTWSTIWRLKDCGFRDFFERQAEQLCNLFVGAAA